jgi:hypothetical protein
MGGRRVEKGLFLGQKNVQKDGKRVSTKKPSSTIATRYRNPHKEL